MWNLAVFDIDGTLTRTNRVDTECFHSAHAEHLDMDGHGDRLVSFTHMTDSHINREIYLRVRGSAPEAAEVETVRASFMSLLRQRFSENAAHFAPVPGAAAAFHHVAELDGWSVAVATGGWRVSATFKLDCIGIDADAWPAAFGDDHETREGIVTTAIGRARDTHAIDRHDRIVSLGDAVWDVTTARNLDLPFIGIAAGERAEALRAAGARHVIPDYRDLDQFSDLLQRAEVPAP